MRPCSFNTVHQYTLYTIICLISIVSYVYILCFPDHAHLSTLAFFVPDSALIKNVSRGSGGSNLCNLSFVISILSVYR